MKTVLSVLVIVALVATVTFTNFVLVTTATVVAIDNGYTFINVDGELFTVTNRPDLIVGTQALIALKTPEPNPETWEIIDVWTKKGH